MLSFLPVPNVFPLASLEVGHHLYWQIGNLKIHGQVFLVSWIVIGLLLLASIAATLQRDETMAELDRRFASTRTQTDDLSYECSQRLQLQFVLLAIERRTLKNAELKERGEWGPTTMSEPGAHNRMARPTGVRPTFGPPPPIIF